MFNPGTFAMDDGGRCLLDVINDPLLLQSFLEDKNEEASNELSSFESALLGRDEVSSTTSCLPPRCELSESMGYSCSGTDKPVALAVSATTSSDVSASSSPQLGPSAVPSRSQSLPSSSASTPATTKATATVAPLPVAPQQAPASRPGVAQVVSASPSPRTSGAPRLIQPKQPQILPKLSSGSANMTTPSAAATTRSQSPRAAQHKATPQPAPVPAPQPATTVQRGAAMGLNTGSPLLIGNPAAAQPGMFPAGPAQGTFLLNQYIPGLGHSPILIQGALGQIQSSLGQIQGVQLALRPPHATGLTLGPQTGPKPHGGHPGPPGTPTLVIPQNLGPRPNIFLAPPRMMSPPSFAIVPGQPLTLQQLQQLQAMLPTQTMLAQPTLGAFQTDQHQSLVQIPTFTQPQILAHDHHHHHHHHHHGALSGPLISTGGSIVSSAPSANIVTHHPVMTTTTVLHPAPPQHIPASVSAPMTSATIQQQPQAPTTTAPPAVEKPVKAPTVNLAELLKEHGIMPESTPPPSPTSSQENTISVEVPVAPAPVTESVQVVVSKSPQTVAVSPQQRVQLSLAHDGSVVLHPHGSSLSTMPAPAPSPGLVATTVTPTSTSAPGGTALSRTHSALLERLSAAPPVSVPDLASLTAPRVSVSAPTMVATPSLVAPSVVTPSMMGATPHPHQLTLHTVNNGLVQTQQLGQPQSFVTLHGTAVANMLCHGANNARINHIVVSPSPSLGQQQQQHHHHPHAVHHTCHAVVSSASSAVVPTTTTTAVMALSSQTAVGRTTVVPTSMAHTVVTVAACPTVTTVTVTPTVVVSTSNSSATAHGSGKCTASMNTQNQQLYEQLQSQITYLNSLKKPTMQQKLLLTQMLAIEEKLRDSSKPQRSAQGRNLALISAVPTSHAHCVQRHEVKPTVVSHPMPAAATIITAKPSAVTTVQVPTIAVATTTRTTSRTTHHKANHADVKPKASILHTGNAASIISTQKVITPHSGPVRIIATASTSTSAACASSTCSSAPCSSASALSVSLASATPMLSSPSVPLASAAPCCHRQVWSPCHLRRLFRTHHWSLLHRWHLVGRCCHHQHWRRQAQHPCQVPLYIPPASNAPSLVANMPVVSCTPSAHVAPLPSNVPAMPCIPPAPSTSLASMPVVSCIPPASTTSSMVSETLVVSCAPSSHYTTPLVSHMPVVSSCVLSTHMTPVVSKAIVVSCSPSAPAVPLVSSKPLVSCLPPTSTSAIISSVLPMSTALSVSCATHTSTSMPLVSTAALMSSPSPLASCTPLMSSAPLVSTTLSVSSAPLMSTTPMTSTAPTVIYPSPVSSAPVMPMAPLTAPSTTDVMVPSMAPHPVASSHLRVPNPASAKLAPLLHHSMHHHHHHQHHIHHHQPSLVGSSMPSVNQRSPPQPKCVRLQHPTNHIIAPPSTTKQILVQVPTIVNKPPTSKSSGVVTAVLQSLLLLCYRAKWNPPFFPKPPCRPEQPPAPPPPPPKPVVVKPKVPDRVQKIHAFHQRLMEDQNGAVTPDTKTPFRSRRDTCERLLRYHVYNSELPREEDLHKTDELFAEVSERLLGESRKLYQKFHYLMLKEGMRECSTAEKIMVDKFFIKHETDALIAEKQAAEEGQYSNIEPPTLPPMPESAWSFESSPAVHLPRPVKEEPPNSWLDDDDRSDLEPAPKRRSIKEEEPETVVVPAEIDPLPLPRVSVTPEHIDLVLGMRKELDMSPPETDEFARELADYEPPMAHFPSSAGLKQQFGNGGNIVPPVMVPDWTCGVKSAKPPSPELDLSGIDGLDDDSSGVGPLGRTHYFGDDDEEEDKDSVELHDQVQSAINSILDFRRAGADDSLGTDSKGAVARGGPEPMDYDDATGDAQPTDSVLDEAVRSILL
nr:LOW QUALITY PROTEIN: mucin-5AC-like [Rhipicephalus microplus]